jgi:hypothetical protein
MASTALLGVRSQYDDSHSWPECLEVAEQFETSHFGHLNIDEGDVIVPLFTFAESVFSIATRVNLIAGCLQYHD